MSEDSELIMDILRTERGWTVCALDDETSFDDAEDRIYLARLNAEIARRIPQWFKLTWSGSEYIVREESFK